MPEDIPFEVYRESWLSDVRADNPSTVDLGHRFAQKLVTQWLDVDESADDLIYCDGAGDGGIDIAYLHRGDLAESEAESASEGDNWFLVQSKYGKAFLGVNTLLEEGRKVIDTLTGQRPRLSSLSADLLEKLIHFRERASDKDRIVLVFATEEVLNEDEKRALEDVRILGQARLGSIFEVDAVSIQTIYRRILEANAIEKTTILLDAAVVPSGEDLLVGTVSLLALYDFLKQYRTETGDLDQIYEKNVRRFLGGRGRVNKGIQTTLLQTPERFGLYNNGITIVVSSFEQHGNSWSLVEPYIVNGCQTTRTIWEFCRIKLDSGGTGNSPTLDEWRERAAQGVVVTKIVRVGDVGENLLIDITRYTNSQNAVREKDFLALTEDFRTWAQQMAERYGIYLEIQRGGWDSRRALQRQKPRIQQFEQWANAFDLLKVYGSGWLGEAGAAFGRNSAFLPNGTVFKRIMEDNDHKFNVNDIVAAYALQQSANAIGFGRGALQTRRQTRFLFYLVTVELLRGVLRAAGLEENITDTLIKLYNAPHSEGINSLLGNATQLIDEYMRQGTENSVFTEPSYLSKFNADLNAFLKSEQLGKSENSPKLRDLINDYSRLMGRGQGVTLAPREIIVRTLND
jgi:hypothetical protein